MNISRLFGLLAGVVLILMSMGAFRLISAEWGNAVRGRHGVTTIETLTLILKAQEKLSAERGPMNGALGAEIPLEVARAKALSDARQATDAAFDAVETQLRPQEDNDVPARVSLTTVREVRNGLTQARRLTDALLKLPVSRRGDTEITRAVSAMIALIGRLTPALNAAESDAAKADPHLVHLIEAARLSADLRDYAGQMGSVFTAALTNARLLTREELLLVERLRGAVGAFRAQVEVVVEKSGERLSLQSAIDSMTERFFKDGLNLVDQTVATTQQSRDHGVSPGDFAARYVPTMRSIVGVRDAALATARERAEQFSAAAERSLMLLVVAITISISVMVLAIVLFRRVIVRPLMEMTPVVEALAKGRFDVAVPATTRQDEMGGLLRALEVFKANTAAKARLEEQADRAAESGRLERQRFIAFLAATFEHNVMGLVGSVTDSAARLELTAQTMSGIANDTSLQADHSRQATGRAAHLVADVSAAAEGMSRLLSETSTQVGRSIEIAGRAAVEAAATDATIRGLAEAAARIDRAVLLIAEIASQTNLLALNATIEAARAGEAGRGFAVVAGEVKQLANQAARATEDIAAQVNSIQSSAQQAVGALDRIGSTVHEINQTASTVRHTVDEQNAAIAAVLRNVADADASSRSVLQRMEQLTVASSTGEQSAQAVSHAAGDLVGMAKELRETVGRFLVELQESA